MTDPKPKPRRDRTDDEAGTPRRPSLGRWLVENMPRGANFDPPGGRRSAKETPFTDGDAA